MQKYHRAIRVLHWLMALCLIGMLVLGFVMDNRVQYDFHKSIGVLLIVLFALRVFVRFLTRIPAFPEKIKKNEARLAKIGHLALYGLMIIMPISGYLMSNFKGYPVKFFGFELITLVEKSKMLGNLANETHEIAAYLLVFMVSIHVLAVMRHQIVDKISLIKRRI